MCKNIGGWLSKEQLNFYLSIVDNEMMSVECNETEGEGGREGEDERECVGERAEEWERRPRPDGH